MIATSLVALCSFLSQAVGLYGCSFETASSSYTPFDACTVAPRADRDAFVDDLLNKMTVPELVRQLHLTFADNVIGPDSRNELYDDYAGPYGIGVIHDWYPTNTSQYNDLQKLNLEKSRLPIPFMQMAECLHGVGSFQQSMFPVPLALSATFDSDLMYRVGRAIGEEATSIGIHGCYSPVLDLGKETRWGRVQEGLGEDFVLTTHMGVAYASGLSKNSSWSEPDAVIPVMKHFAAHGSPSGGINAAPFVGFGWRQIMSEMLVPFKAVYELGGARGVMMAYHDIDGIPCVVHPDLYGALDSWGFDGFHIADDGAVKNLQSTHAVADSPASAISQWLNAGGSVQYYDYPLPTYQSAIEDLVKNGTVSIDTLRKRARGVLNAKWDLGLFHNPYISDNLSSAALTQKHEPLTLEAALRSFVLLENRNNTLPLDPVSQGIKKIALVGPFADTYNFGDYSGVWGAAPIDRAYTIRHGIEEYLAANTSGVTLATSWGANSWQYNAQYPVPRDLLATPNGTRGALQATYFHDTNFSQKAFERVEVPNRQWGLYPPNGLNSNNFSAIWEGSFNVASDAEGWLGIAIGANSTGRLVVDGKELVSTPYSNSTNSPTIMGNIEGLPFVLANGMSPPLGSAPFSFKAGSNHSVRIEFAVWNTAQKFENVDSLNAQLQFFWNLVDREDPVGKAKDVAKDADVIVFAGGAGWNSDGESGDRATMSLSPNQTELVDALFEFGKPVIMLIHGGRPFALPDYYARAAAVLNVYFPGQRGGQAIAQTLFGLSTPGGRLPVSIPSSSATLPALYNYKQAAHGVDYLDLPSYALYSFGHGLSYTTFTRSDFTANPSTFSDDDTITFSVTVKNTGRHAGSDVPQVYLLRRVSSVVQPLRQLVAFKRVYLASGEEKKVEFGLEVGRFLKIYNRTGGWELERCAYVFALTASDHTADTSVNVTLHAN
ncbi:glycoside hydrolase family 3 protein [Dentipellis sp. KUC8613]|nr:glycoside hydrolase family 3 protein [Dentipellis sp. KUC8613]